MNIFPDRNRSNDSNKTGLYNHSFAICTASTGELLFLNWNPTTSRSDLVQLRLHSPAETAVLERGIQTTGISLCYMNCIALSCGQQGILFRDIEGKLYSNTDNVFTSKIVLRSSTLISVGAAYFTTRVLSSV